MRMIRSMRILRGVRLNRRARLAALIGLPALLLLVLVGWRVLGERGVPESVAAPAEEAVPVKAPRPTSPVSFSAGCVTSECHAFFKTAQRIHAPAVDGSCDVCHLEESGDHLYPVRHDKGSGCVTCHDTGESRPFQHEQLSGAGCTGCHDPHATDSPFLLLEASVAGTCARCHAPADDLLLHSPYKNGHCTACHDPHESDFPGLLNGGTGIEHCRTCHEALVSTFESVKRSHLQIKRGCLACHNVHGTDYKGHVIASTGVLCLSCHEEIKVAIDGAAVSHDAVLTGERCLSCHDPHASNLPMMLREDQVSVCLECHADPLLSVDGREIPGLKSELTRKKFEHGPVKSGHCNACHSIHGAQHERLLKEPAPAILQGVFDIKHYALCFQCHTRELVLEERTWTATRFRDGDLNLHYLHVRAGDGGRTCTSCHAVHGSDLPLHISSFVRFEGSGWRMPVGFVKEEDGGTCSSGCHETLGYRRSRPEDSGARGAGK